MCIRDRYETDPAAAYAELRDLDDAALSIEQMKLAISEAKGVLLQLGIEMLV